MRKIAEKVALVAQICVAVIFVLTALLYVCGVIPQNSWQDNAVALIMLIVLAILFVGTSAYLLYMNFSSLQNLKRILLYADAKSATTTNVKVVNKIAKSCATKIEGVRVKKTKIHADEKNGYTATFVVEVSAPSVTPVLEQLRCLVEDSFKEALGLVFNTITFVVVKLKNQQTASVENAKKKARNITESANEVQDLYQNPTGEQPSDEQVANPIVDDTVEIVEPMTPADEPYVTDEQPATPTEEPPIEYEIADDETEEKPQ